MEENKSSKKGLIICIVIICVLIVALAVVYYLGFVKKDNVETQENNAKDETQTEKNLDDNDKNEIIEEDETNKEEEEKEEFKVSYKTETLEELTVGEAKYICTGEIPNITGINESAAQKMENYLIDVYKEFAKSVYESYTKEDIEEILSYQEGGNIGFSQSYEVILENEKVVTFKYTRAGSLGGVGWYKETGVTFDIKTGEVIEIEDIVNDEDEYIKACEEYVFKELKKDERFEELNPGYEQIINKDIEIMEGYLTEDGIVCAELEKYEISNGAAGEFRFTIPYELVEDYIDSDYIF